MADDAGALLVRSGLVSTSALEEARARVDAAGGTIGEQLVVANAIGDDALTDFYRSRLLVPQVNPNTLAKLPVRVVAAIPADMAVELRAIPVALDGENNLTVAMSDPSDRHAVDEIAFFTGAYVVRACATQMQIAWCLAHYYGHVTTLGQRLLGGTPERPAHPVSAPRPRTKGLTGKVDAMRHRGIVPMTGPVDVLRPRADAIVAAPSPAPASEPAPSVGNATEPLGVITDEEAGSNGIPEHQPRARSISGEIKISKRAPSIRPPMSEDAFDDDDDDDDSAPVITVEVAPQTHEDATGPRKVPVRRRPIVKSDPPELAARAGEVAISAGPSRQVDLEEPRIIIADDQLTPAHGNAIDDLSGEFRSVAKRDEGGAPTQTIEVADETSSSVIIHERYDAESAPILLDRRLTTDATTLTQRAPSSVDDPDDEVVELAPKQARPATRSEKATQVGVGVPASTRTHRDTEASVPEGADDPTGVDMLAAPPGVTEDTDPVVGPPPPAVRTEDTNPGVALPPRPAAAALSEDHGDDDDEDDDEDDVPGRATSVMSAVELDDAIPERSSGFIPAHLAKRRPIEHDPVDDGWGPPGTTIPPPLLGAVPGSDDDSMPGRIPMASLDSAPLIVAPPSPPEAARGMPAGASRAVEDSSSRLVELIRALEHAAARDEVVALMISHLGESHRRAGFFVSKHNELGVFSISPKPPSLSSATLRLDRPSTLQDVVGTRLPYRGPMHDDASRAFLAAVLGATPPEILLVPVAVRERVVGVLFGEHRMKHTFDDQLALASRAAGMALERILVAKRG